MLTQLVSTCGRGVFLAVTAIYFTQIVDLGVREVGIALSAAGALGVVASYLFGIMADRVSARVLMTWALAAEGLALIALSWTRTLPFLVLFAGLDFAMNRGGFTARQTLLARAFTGPERTGARARVRVSINVGIGLGSATAALVLASGEPSTFRLAMTLAGGVYGIAAAVAARVPSDVVIRPAARAAHAIDASRRGPWRDKRYLVLVGVNCLSTTQFSITETAMPIWVVTHTEAPHALVSVLLLVNTGIVVMLQVPFNRGLEAPLRSGRAFIQAGLLMALGCSIYAAAAFGPVQAAAVLLILAAVAHGIAEVLFSGAGFSLGYEFADNRHQGAYQGVFAVGQSLGMSLGPVLVTSAIAAGSQGWAALALLYAAVGLAGWLVPRMRLGMTSTGASCR